jgi:hypothetical protein
MKIKIPQQKQKMAMEVAILRHEAKNQSFRNSSILTKDKDTGIPNEYMPHYIGALGEIAWSILTGENIDREIYPVRDGGQDFSGIEIKTITYFGNGEPELKITKKEYSERKPPNLYVLARTNIKSYEPEVEILGKITRNEFDRLKIEKQYGINKPVNYILPLSKMEKL